MAVVLKSTAFSFYTFLHISSCNSIYIVYNDIIPSIVY